MESIVLIDAFAQIYRQFYGIRAMMTNPRGEPVNALYGMARLLLALEDRFPGGYGAVAYDHGKPVRRVALCPQYKAQRPPMPPELRQQLPAIREWFDAFGWPLVEFEDMEADDAIAAITTHREGHPVYILTPDKDIAQLVGDDVHLLAPQKNQGWEILGAEEVRGKFGVGPSQLRDYLALMGDNSDNIEGVAGIGAKRAADLLNRHGTMEAILAAAESGTDKVSQTLRGSHELIARNQKMVELFTELPSDWKGLETIRRREPDWKRLTVLAEEQNFKSILPALEKHAKSETSSAAIESKKTTDASKPAKKPAGGYQQLELF
jgi:DNA polymerase-1